LIARLEHDPEKCEAVFPDKRLRLSRDHAQNKDLKRDDDSTKSHRALEQRVRWTGI
jgi:hypothetical protein